MRWCPRSPARWATSASIVSGPRPRQAGSPNRSIVAVFRSVLLAVMDHLGQLLAVEHREARRLRLVVGELGLGRPPPAGHGGGGAYLAQGVASSGSSGSGVKRSLQIMLASPG